MTRRPLGTAASTTPAIRCSCSGGEAEWLRHPGSGSKDLWANNAFVVSNLDRLARMTCFTRTWSPEKDASQSAAPPGTGDQEERCMNESQMPVILDVDKCGVVRACNLPLENVWECAAAMEVVQHMTKEYFAQELDRKHGGEFCYAEVEPTDGLIRDELEWLAFGLLKLQHIMLRAQLQGVGLITYERTMPAVHNRFEGMPAQPRTGREAGYMQPRMLLLAAPNNFLARRAEVCELHKLVLPQQDGAFVGGFVPEQFLRGGPLQPYYVQTKNISVTAQRALAVTSGQRMGVPRTLTIMRGWAVEGMNGFPSVEGITSAFVDIAASTQGVTAAATNQIISKFHGVVHAQPVLEAVGAGDSRSRGLPLLLPGALPGALPAAVSGPPEQQRRQRACVPGELLTAVSAGDQQAA
eukprot:gene26707-32810_t